MPSKSKAVKKTNSKTISKNPLVSVIMGSKSDYPTMSKAVEILKEFNIPHEVKVVSAHRTPERLFEFSKTAKKRGLKVIIAGAGGAAHLPGMVASLTTVPVFGVPVESRALKGMDSLLSIVQMPGGIPVGTLAIGEAGAKNAGLIAVAVLASFDDALSKKLEAFRQKQTSSIPESV